MLNVEPYGGGLWRTWFDRELSIAGRVIIRKEDGSITSKIMRVEKPILSIPSLSIHLTESDDRVAIKTNLHQHIVPLFGIMSKEDKKSEKNEVRN